MSAGLPLNGCLGLGPKWTPDKQQPPFSNRVLAPSHGTGLFPETLLAFSYEASPMQHRKIIQKRGASCFIAQTCGRLQKSQGAGCESQSSLGMPNFGMTERPKRQGTSQRFLWVVSSWLLGVLVLQLLRLHVCMYACMYVCMYVVYACTYVHMYVCLSVCLYVWALLVCRYACNVCLHTCMHVCVYVCTIHRFFEHHGGAAAPSPLPNLPAAFSHVCRD